MRINVGRESLKPAIEYIEYLNRVGGLNPFGKPMFRLVWGETFTETFWGQMEGGSKGQHFHLRYRGIPRWHLEMWNPSENFGTPEAWYAQSYDPLTGLHALGDYPFEGDYVQHSRLHSLDFDTLESLLPRIEAARAITLRKRREMIQAQMDAEKRASRQRIHEAYVDASPAFGGVAGTYTSNREKLLERLNLRLTADQVKPGSRQDEHRWANEKLKNQEIV